MLARHGGGQSTRIHAAADAARPADSQRPGLRQRGDITEIRQLLDGFNASFAVLENHGGQGTNAAPAYVAESAPLRGDPVIRPSQEASATNHMASVFLAATFTSFGISRLDADFVNTLHRAGRAAIGVRRPTQSRTYRTMSSERS